MSPQRIAAIALRQFYIMRGSPARILPIFIWVGVDMVLWGFFTRYLNHVTDSGLDFVPRLLGAVLLWDFFIRVMIGMTSAFFEDVWARNFLNLFTSPLSIPEYVGGLVLTSIATSALGLMLMMLMASAIFGLSFLTYGLLLIPFLLILFLFGIALGIFCSALVMRLGPATEWLIWPIPAVISPFAGVFYPLSTLPEWMQFIGRTLPPSYVFDGIRALSAGQHFPLAALMGSLALTLGYIAIAIAYFLHVYRHAVRSGLLARYHAESVN
ncbi:ABC transporter permease [Acidihalobacter prosperus]|uniref:Transport permease protein n=1 Tax=Acidihalobacter prosperus TaxID=160660 RepID=A0A1A6C2S8_9GAMM|nr:ABC transporter permease [Acidihalobacter prosperus]OBS08859.1 ABC transporter [Acidihalobacter prosperus]